MAIFSSYFDITRGYWFILDHRFDASLQDVAGHFKDLIKMQDKELRDLRQEVPFIMAQSNSRIPWADVRNWDSWDSWSICWRYFMISQDHFTNNALHILQMCWIAEPLIFRCVKPKNQSKCIGRSLRLVFSGKSQVQKLKTENDELRQLTTDEDKTILLWKARPENSPKIRHGPTWSNTSGDVLVYFIFFHLSFQLYLYIIELAHKNDKYNYI